MSDDIQIALADSETERTICFVIKYTWPILYLAFFKKIPNGRSTCQSHNSLVLHFVTLSPKVIAFIILFTACRC